MASQASHLCSKNRSSIVSFWATNVNHPKYAHKQCYNHSKQQPSERHLCQESLSIYIYFFKRLQRPTPTPPITAINVIVVDDDEEDDEDSDDDDDGGGGGEVKNTLYANKHNSSFTLANFMCVVPYQMAPISRCCLHEWKQLWEGDTCVCVCVCVCVGVPVGRRTHGIGSSSSM